MVAAQPVALQSQDSASAGRGTAALIAGLFLVSTAGPFLVMARLDAVTVVFLRLGLAAAIFLGWAVLRRELRLHDSRWIVVGALLLTSHFVLWVAAFDLTDFASNHLLLVLQPVIAAFLAMRLGEPATRSTWISIALAVTGLTIIAGGDFALGSRALAGDALCVLADLAIALFYLVTREARRVTPLPTFMGTTFAVGAVVLWPVVWYQHGLVFSLPGRSWYWVAALVLLTTVGGHGLMNLAARTVRFFVLNIVIVLEPAIAIALGAVLFGAAVTPLQVAGGVLLAASVVVGLR